MLISHANYSHSNYNREIRLSTTVLLLVESPNLKNNDVWHISTYVDPNTCIMIVWKYNADNFEETVGRPTRQNYAHVNLDPQLITIILSWLDFPIHVMWLWSRYIYVGHTLDVKKKKISTQNKSSLILVDDNS